MQFDQAGPVNTQATLAAAFKRARELGVSEVVVATTSGQTAFKAQALVGGERLVAVTYHYGFRKPFERVMPLEDQKRLEAGGVPVVSATHALSGLERSVAQRYQGTYPVLIMADTLRLLGQGTKVAVEVSVMAADAGAISGADIVAVGGTAKGADTALVIKPAHMNNFFDLRIREVVCKPSNF